VRAHIGETKASGIEGRNARTIAPVPQYFSCAHRRARSVPATPSRSAQIHMNSELSDVATSASA
jgi:hypothetical protein